MHRFLTSLLALATLTAPLRATNVLSYHYDPQSTGQNLTESGLTPAAVAAFRKRWMQLTDGYIYAQPLYVEGVNITTGSHPGLHNTLFVATEHDSLYAFDAINGKLLWHRSLLTDGLPSATHITTVPSKDTETTDLIPEIGITGTPVIDSTGAFLYVAAKTKQTVADAPLSPRWVYTLFKISTSDGSIAAHEIIASTYKNNNGFQARTDNDPSAPQDPWVGAVGYDNIYINGHYRVYFNALREMNRPGLLLYNGNVYIAFGSHGDNGPYHGWLLSYDTATLTLNGVFNDTPNGSEGGIWASGAIPCVDGSGNIYVVTGNGSFDGGSDGNGGTYGLDGGGFPTMGDYGDSFIKIALDPVTSATNQNVNGWGLKAVDYFAPMDNFTLNANDTDLGSGGLVILPDSAGSEAHPHLLIGCGKAGKVYLIDRDDMGKFSPYTENNVQSIANVLGGSFSTPAYFNSNLYWVGIGNNAQMFSIADASFNASPLSVSGDGFGFPGATPTITASGTNNALLWALDRDSRQLRVYDAQNLATEYWTSATAADSRDKLGPVVKFTTPTVADGMAFVGTTKGVYAYGGPPPPTAPPASPNQLTAYALYGSQVQLAWVNRATDQTGFAIEDSTNGVTFTQVATVAANALSATIGSLAPSSFHYFRIRAFNTYKGLSYSGYSNLTGATTTSNTQYLDFGGGFAGSTSQLNYTGTAALVSGSIAQLTDGGYSEAGAIWTRQKQNIDRFDTAFVFRLLPDNAGFADGFTFCVQNISDTALGSTGGDLGYAGITKSIAIKVDAYPNLSTTGLYTNGAHSNNGAKPAIDAGPAGLNFQSGDLFMMHLTYLNGILTQTITDTVTNAIFTHQYRINIAAELGATTGYIGFTGGTGGETSIQQILAWTFAPLPYSAPAAPAGLTATPASGTQINLAWKDTASDAAGYLVDRRSRGGTWATIAYLQPPTLTYADTALQPGATYAYTIHASNAVGYSGGSNIATVKTPATPAPLASLKAITVTAGAVTLQWPAPATDADAVILTRQASGSGRHELIAKLPATSRAYTDTSVTPGLTYTYRIQSSNQAGASSSTSTPVTTPPL